MELKLIDGSLHVYEGGILIITTRGNPTKINEKFTSLEEAQEWYQTTIPFLPPEEPDPSLQEEQEVVIEEVLNETIN